MLRFIRLTGAIVLCLFIGKVSCVADPFPLKALAQQDEDVQVETLPNGMTLLVHERLLSEEGVSLRLVWNPPSSEHQFTGWDISNSTLKWTEEFFEECRDDLMELKEIISYPSYWGFTNEGLSGDQFAVIVVGNITLEEVRPLIELYFDNLFSEDMEFSKGWEPLEAAPQLGELFCNLKDEWVERFQEKLFENHLEASGHWFQEEWLINPLWGRRGQPKGLREFLEEVNRIKVNGYSAQEFIAAKEGILEELRGPFEVNHSFLASFYSDLFQIRDDGVRFRDFLELSKELVQEMTYEDVEVDLEDFLDDALSFLEDLYTVHQEEPQDRFAFADPLSLDRAWEYSSPSCAGDAEIALINDMPDVDLFHSLPLSSSEMRQIYYIISTIAEHNILELAFKKKDLEKRGKRINQVHPLRFMGYILSTSYLRKCAYEIEKSSFKWDSFVGGFAKRMKEEHAKGNVMPYLKGFADLLGAPVEQVAYYVHKRNFEGLVRYLM